MIAFVLSGGGSRGGLQAGAILALLDHGLVPDLIVGTSVGSINGAALAAATNIEGARCLAERWRTVRRSDIFPGNPANVAWRLLSRQPSLYPSSGLQRFVLGLLPSNVRRFKDLQRPLLVTTTSLRTGRLRLFGDDPQERLLDAIMASSAIPPYLPPWRYGDDLFVDGGVVANLPVSVALERGATTVYAVEIGYENVSVGRVPSLGLTVSSSIRSMLAHQVQAELAALGRYPGVQLHHIRLLHYSGLPHEDFSHGPALLELGYESTRAYLDQGELPPLVPPPPRPRTYHLLAERLRNALRVAPQAAQRGTALRRVLRLPRPALRRPPLHTARRSRQSS